MHELSIALNILDIVQEECMKAGSKRVLEVVVRIGDLSGVDAQALTTSLRIAANETLMQGATIRIEKKTGKGYCSTCNKEFAMNDILSVCPACFQPAAELLEGQEMELLEIVVE